MSSERVDYIFWLRRIVSRDATWPIVISFTPVAIQMAFPKNDALLVIASLLLPIAAFLIRIRSGNRLIEANYCSAVMQGAQSVFLVLGMLPLLALDALLMAVPLAAFTKDDLSYLAVVVAIHLAAMIIAMYPGVEPTTGD